MNRQLYSKIFWLWLLWKATLQLGKTPWTQCTGNRQWQGHRGWNSYRRKQTRCPGEAYAASTARRFKM